MLVSSLYINTQKSVTITFDIQPTSVVIMTMKVLHNA